MPTAPHKNTRHPTRPTTGTTAEQHKSRSGPCPRPLNAVSKLPTQRRSAAHPPRRRRLTVAILHAVRHARGRESAAHKAQRSAQYTGVAIQSRKVTRVREAQYTSTYSTPSPINPRGATRARSVISSGKLASIWELRTVAS